MSEIYVFICTKTTAPPAVPNRAFDQGEFNRRISNTFRTFGDGKLTVGDLKLRPTAAAIPNHLLCDGSAVSRIAFPELFEYLGITEGAGDRATTFNLPDYFGTPLEPPATAPVQTVTESGTVESEADPVVTEPTEPAQTGGTEGGSNTVSGGVPQRPLPSQLF